MFTRVAYVDGRQAASADRLWAGIEGSGGGGQAKIAMSRQHHGLRGWTVQAISLPSGVTACNNNFCNRY